MKINSIIIYKAMFYSSLAVINIIAFSLIGLSFLGASNANGEGSPIMTESGTFIKRSLLIVIISLAFAGLAFLVSFLFRNVIGIGKTGLKKIFFIELGAFIIIYLIVYSYLYLRFTT
ncbi:hypothetical protein DDR33_23340 [Pararcticibacter amylolyticus]|uniref:Uncharacterized protein n=2 Tax=Pararcticibacter amylolyticus TaxID=2173175 RepID=A0A2U2PA17_9SPHI|nr:hypothetical protein DDR33_23340 [Pararcticibacter amylolyticus]